MASGADFGDFAAQAVDVRREVGLGKTTLNIRRVKQVIPTYVQRKKVALRTGDRSTAILRARASGRAELGIQAEQEHLFAAFGASFHPLALCQERHAFIRLRYHHGFWILFDFNDFLPSVLGEEDT